MVLCWTPFMATHVMWHHTSQLPIWLHNSFLFMGFPNSSLSFPQLLLLNEELLWLVTLPIPLWSLSPPDNLNHRCVKQTRNWANLRLAMEKFKTHTFKTYTPNWKTPRTEKATSQKNSSHPFGTTRQPTRKKYCCSWRQNTNGKSKNWVQNKTAFCLTLRVT